MPKKRVVADRGLCLTEGCGRPRRATLFCNKCYLQHHFKQHPRTPQTRGWRHTMAKEIAEIVGVSPQQAITIIDTVCTTMATALRKGESVKIRGFGSFHIHQRSIYVFGRTPYFRPAKELRWLVNHPDPKGLSDVTADP